MKQFVLKTGSVIGLVLNVFLILALISSSLKSYYGLNNPLFPIDFRIQIISVFLIKAILIVIVVLLQIKKIKKKDFFIAILLSFISLFIYIIHIPF